MTKTIDTLQEDIYYVLDSTVDHDACPDASHNVSIRMKDELVKATERRDAPREHGKLWASDLGKPCLRQHWYNFNGNDEQEPLLGHTKFKFLYGNLLEESVLWLAEEAGHTVRYPQERVELELDNGWKVSGRIDAVIDGTLVDVKSTSSYGYKRYKEGLDATNDSFGYRWQLGFYHSFLNSEVQLNDISGFVWIDKQNGHIKYTPCPDVPTEQDIRVRAEEIAEAVDMDESDVPRAFTPEPYGKSGNLKLPIGCSYCAHKFKCWRDSNAGMGVRTFMYSNGPVHFTDIKRAPNISVPELVRGE